MISVRIKAIASFVSKEDIVVDIGCDHGYLDIYLKENNLCQEVIASDIKESALNMAKSNFQKRKLKIKTFLSDGFNNIDAYFNTAVIAGMGTTTILKILNSDKKPDKLIIASNNELAKLRLNLNNIGYMIKDEKVIFDKHYYTIMLCNKGSQKLKKKEILFGISNNKEYFNYLINKNKEIINKVPFTKKINLLYQNYILKGLIEKK